MKTIYIATATQEEEITYSGSYEEYSLKAFETEQLAENFVKGLALKDINDLPFYGVDKEVTNEEDGKSRVFESDDGKIAIAIRISTLEMEEEE